MHFPGNKDLEVPCEEEMILSRKLVFCIQAMLISSILVTNNQILTKCEKV